MALTYTYEDIGGCNCNCPSGIFLSGCCIPTVLHGSHSILGPFTVTYSGTTITGWTGTSTYTYPGCTFPLFTCPASTVTINWRFNPFGTPVIEYDYPYNHRPFATAGASACPDNITPAGTTVDAYNVSESCTYSFVCSPLVFTFAACTSTGASTSRWINCTQSGYSITITP